MKQWKSAEKKLQTKMNKFNSINLRKKRKANVEPALKYTIMYQSGTCNSNLPIKYKMQCLLLSCDTCPW